MSCFQIKKKNFFFVLGNSLVVWWLGLGTLTAKGQGLIPGQATEILQAAKTKKKHNQFCSGERAYWENIK